MPTSPADEGYQHGAPRDIPFLLEPEVRTTSHWNDPHELRMGNWIQPWDYSESLDVGIITVPSSKSSIKHNGAFAAPNALREARYVHTTYSPDYDVDVAALKVREVGDVAVPVLDLREGMSHIQQSLKGCYKQPEGFFPIVIGGDHAVTAPSVRAFCEAHPTQQIGLIHFDAHNDVRVLDHGPTNGTPIRQILTSGFNISGKNLVQIGIHGFMNASYYKRWVEGHGATIFTGRQCRQLGIEEVVRRAQELAGAGTDAIYVTVDIDVLELGYAAGTAAATPEGLHPMDLFEALFILGQDPKVACIDFVEMDPYRDVAEITTRTLNSAMLTFMAGLFLRTHDGWRGYDDTPITDD